MCNTVLRKQENCGPSRRGISHKRDRFCVRRPIQFAVPQPDCSRVELMRLATPSRNSVNLMFCVRETGECDGTAVRRPGGAAILIRSQLKQLLTADFLDENSRIPRNI